MADMNVVPVLQRELKTQARQAFTYWLRVSGAGGVLGMATYFALAVGLRPNSGAELFAYLHGILHLLTWLLVPLLTADCVSRERREGTLGLLFLTPLSGRDIVVAKGAVQGLRALTLLLAVVPIATLSALVGGVDWRQIAASLTLNAAAACLALGAGLLASCWSRSWIRSLLLSYCVTGILAFLFCLALTSFFSLALGRPGYVSFQRGVELALGINPEFFTSSYYYRAGVTFAPAATSAKLFQAALAATLNLLLASVLFLFLIVGVAARSTAVSWQERPPHPLLLWLRQRLCTPVVMHTLLKRWMRRTLERNPIGWLERRSWSGRLVIWGWLAVMTSLYSLLLTDANFFLRSLDEVHIVMGTALILSLAANSASSFRRERETRVLELLLVSPVNEWQLIFGRLRGLWGQFLPSLVFLLGGWTYLSLVMGDFSGSAPRILSLAVMFVATPVIGLYFSLLCRHFLTSLGWTVLVAIVLPVNLLPLMRIGIALMYWRGRFPRGELSALDFLAHPALLQLVIAAVLCASLHRRLVRRRFATESS